MNDCLVPGCNNYLDQLKQRRKKNILLEKRKQKVKKRTVNDNAKNIFSKLLSIYYDDYNDITDEEKEKMGEKYNPRNLHLKGQRSIESKKAENSNSQPEEAIDKRVKLRRQKTDNNDLFDMSSRSTDDVTDEFNDIPDMPPLEGDEVVRIKNLDSKQIIN